MVRLAHELGAEVSYHDPYGWSCPSSSCALETWRGEELSRCDLACVVTAHPEVDHTARSSPRPPWCSTSAG